MSTTVTDTAFTIAVIRADESRLPPAERLFEDRYAPIFAAAGAHAAEGTQRFLDLPFFRDGIRLRTRFIDDAVRSALSDGLTQVVVLGVGFDTRALRLPEVAARGARVFEVDFAEQLSTRRALLAAAGEPLPSSIAQVACDFAAPDFDTRLAADLAARGLRAGAGALFVWEGVTAYIPRASIDRSLAFMASTGEGARVVFDFGSFLFHPEDAATVARRHGFTAFEESGFDDLWRRYLPGEPHENAWVARVGVARV